MALLVALLLLLDCTLLAGSTWLVNKTEEEARKTLRNRVISACTGQYINTVYDVIHFLVQNGSKNALDPDFMLRLQDLRRSVDEKYSALLNACADDKAARQKILDVNERVKKFENLYGALVGKPDSVRSQKESPWFKAQVDGFVAEMARFNEDQNRFEDEGNAAQQRLRAQIKNLLLFGILVNIAAALFLGVQLDKTILHRINRLIDNTRRMRHKLPLHPELDGSDEIKELDDAFHEMSKALKKEQEQLSASEARNRAFIEGVPIGLMSLDQSGKIEIANLFAANLFGLEPKNMIGKDVSSLFVTGQLSQADYWSQLKTSASGRTVEVAARAYNGKEFAAEVTLAAERGEQKSYLASVANIQEKHELAELRQSVLAMVSHELRTPLTSIAGFLKLVTLGSFGEISDELKVQASGAQNSTGRLIALVNDLLDLEKLESNATTIKKAPCELGTIFSESFNVVSIIAKTRGIELRLVPERCNLEIMADSTRIIQVIINLLANAIKFSPDKSEIKVTWKQQNGFLRITVEDNGPGIDSEYQEFVFERFQQVKQPGVTGGTGLGLPICKTIIEQHGGQIGVESSQGKGSVFWFTLPCDDDD